MENVQVVSVINDEVVTSLLGAIQKLRNGQKGEGVDDFVTYRYVYFEEEGILPNSCVTAFANLRTQISLSSIFRMLWNHQKKNCRSNSVHIMLKML